MDEYSKYIKEVLEILEEKHLYSPRTTGYKAFKKSDYDMESLFKDELVEGYENDYSAEKCADNIQTVISNVMSFI